MRLRGKGSRLWCRQLGVEPTTHGFGDRVATLVHLPAYLFGFPLRLSHAHARLRPRKHLKRHRSVMARRTHPHAQFSASIVISTSGMPIRSDIVRALPGLWYGIAVLPCLRGTYAAYGAFSFGFRLSALRNTHNPSELHGKRMAERLPLQCSGTLSGGTLCHLPTVVPHRFFRRGFRLYRLRIAQPFSMCRHTVAGWEVRPPAPYRGVAHAVRRIPVIYRWRVSG